MDPFTLTAGAAAVSAGAVATMVRRASLARARDRAAIFDEIAPLFDQPLLAQQPDGFARLSGRLNGQRFDLRVMQDTLTMRKLPALWLLVTLAEPQPLTATADILLRPSGAEPFSPFMRLPVTITPPPGLPADAGVRSDGKGALPDLGILSAHLPILHEAPAKELLMTPGGLRIVWLTEEADRTRYLLYRDAELGRRPLSAALARRLTGALSALAADLAEAVADRRKSA